MEAYAFVGSQIFSHLYTFLYSLAIASLAIVEPSVVINVVIIKICCLKNVIQTDMFIILWIYIFLFL